MLGELERLGWEWSLRGMVWIVDLGIGGSMGEDI